MLTEEAKREKRQHDLRAGIAAPAGSLGGLAWATLAPPAALMPADLLLNRGRPVADLGEMAKLRESAQFQHKPPVYYLEGKQPGHERDFDDFTGGFTTWNKGEQGIDYDNPSVLIGRQARPWAWAHEFGHQKFIENHPTLGRMGMDYYNPNVALLGSTLPSLMPTRNAGRLAAILGALGSLPTVASELGASHEGGKLLAQQSGNKLDYLKAYGGVPTYLAAAAAPLAAYGIASGLGRWDKDDKKKEKHAADDWCTRLVEHL